MNLKRIFFLSTFLLLLCSEGQHIYAASAPLIQQKVYVIRTTRRPYLRPEVRPYRRHLLIPHSIPRNLHPKPIRQRPFPHRRHR